MHIYTNRYKQVRNNRCISKNKECVGGVMDIRADSEISDPSSNSR